MRPLIRWLGSKTKLAPWYLQNMPPHRLYVETHGGSASLLLAKPRSATEVLNDVDQELFNLYGVVRDPVAGDKLLDAMLLTPFSQDEFLLAENFEIAADPVERARRFVVRQAQAFGNDVRTTGKPRSWRVYTKDANRDESKSWLSYVYGLHDIMRRMQGVSIHNDDAVKVIKKHDGTDTLFFCDPPYVQAKVNAPHLNYRHVYTDDDHCRLLDALIAAKGMVMLCGYSTGLYDDALQSWRRLTTTAQDQKRQVREEVLWLSPRAAAALDAAREASRRQPDLFGAA